MERIQAAIAKARAARGGARPAARPRNNASAWAELPAHRLSPELMDVHRIVQEKKSPETVAFDVLRTRALKLMDANGWKRVAITSPTAGCGKTTVAINLAMGLARNVDVSCILMDVDMRRPGLADRLGLTSGQMASDVLQGLAPFEENACRISDHFAVSINTAASSNPSDFLQSSSVDAVLSGIEARYRPTAMLFDMPPLLVNDDTISFLPHVDCAILVAAAEHTTMDEIDKCEKELAEYTNVMGVVLNKCHFTGRAYGYNYYDNYY
jgi:Mrp family chromosome partitioning ATPase